MSEYTIVVPDNEVLSCVCGTNDKNLKLIEEHLGVPVFTRGNELSITVDNQELQQKFQFIVDRIVDEIQSGEKNGEDIVLSVLNTRHRANMEEICIQVPGAVRRADDTAPLEVEFLNAVSRPTHDAGHGEDGRIYLLWQANHLIDKATVEIEVGAHWFLGMKELHDALYAFLFDKFQELILLYASFFFRQFASQFFQFYGSRVAHGIDRVANTIDKSLYLWIGPTSQSGEYALDHWR